MERIEEVAHFRSLFRQMKHDKGKILNLIYQIQQVALSKLTRTVIAKVPPPILPDHVRKSYEAKGVNKFKTSINIYIIASGFFSP